VLAAIMCAPARAEGPVKVHPALRVERNAPLVKTDEGPVRGLVAGNHGEFLGIPYAAPPTGTLRWKAPIAHAAWTAPIDATHFRSSCAQIPFAPGVPDNSSEDCLYLNIFTPSPPRRHLPVMVWIHGGAFVVGSGNDSDGSTLAAKGKVVVVSINYRLGPLGFLVNKTLDAENPNHVSGNYGLLDQQAALGWVRRNIAGFGGDPSRVTIFGESAGGISVCLQLQSPGARGLFQRAINESGPCQMTSSVAQARPQGDQLIAALGCKNASDALACMRSKPARQLIRALPSSPTGGGILWFPVVDGFVLPQTAEAAFKSGKFTRVPLINGSNHDEGRLFVAFGKPIAADGYGAIVKARFGNSAARVMEEYPLKAYPTPTDAWAAVFTDSFFSCSIRRTTRVLAPQVPVYAYEFNDPKAPNTMLPNAQFDLRAYHAAEIQYVWQTRFPSNLEHGPAPLSPDQFKLSDRMMTYWTRFAATGRPDGAAPKWSAYQDAQDQVLSFAPGDIRYETNFAKDHHCAFWDALNSQ